MTRGDLEEKIQLFEEWCKENGLIKHPQLEIRSNKESNLSVFLVSNDENQDDNHQENTNLKKKV